MKKSPLSRREFLKLSTFTSMAGLLSLTRNAHLPQNNTGGESNIIIILLDALSAKHISLYGHPRETMPNLESFAKVSTVFHQHHSAGNFTAPSTASLLTGTYPWTHRNLHLNGSITREYVGKNIFSVLPQTYTTFGYTQNPFVEILLDQFKADLDRHPLMAEGSLIDKKILQRNENYQIGFLSEEIIRGEFAPYKPALFFGTLIDIIQELIFNLRKKQYEKEYILIPNNETGLSFVLEETFQWVFDSIQTIPAPFFAYYHLFPPHGPYTPTNEFLDYFDDDLTPIQKPEHVFSTGESAEVLKSYSHSYDQYIAHTDDELGHLLDNLKTAGYFENSYILVTSDHGEIFERGIHGHTNQVFFEPLLRIPLVIHQPGQNDREDVDTPTSIVDILPTVCQITGQPVPDWVEGKILPGFENTQPELERAIFFVEAKENSKFLPLTKATTGLIKWPYKLVHYFGYELLEDGFELFHLEDDPEELNNLYEELPVIAQSMQNELRERQTAADKPHQR